MQPKLLIKTEHKNKYKHWVNRPITVYNFTVIINENKKYIQHDSEDKFKTKHWRLHGVDGALVILLHTKSIKMY